jgi:CubicO group peptidase (beta-lactamase class C family)
MVKKLIIIFLIMSMASICRADYELRLNDGVTLTWREFTVEGNQYCTQKEFGKFCLSKNDVVSLKEIKGVTDNTLQMNRVNVSAPAKPATLKIVHEIPVTGRDAPGVNLFDEVMLNAMKRIGCSAATMAVADHGTMVYSRGYGWMDKEKKTPLQPDAMIGIASCEKPVTAAAIKQLAREGRLDLDAGLFALMKVTPRGPVKDERVNKITIRHLLEHKAGWGPDPVSGVAAALRKSGVADPIPIESLLSLIMTQPLKNEPGTVSEYCNFGYETLRYVLEKFSGRRTSDYFRNILFKPNSVTGFYGAGLPLHKSAPPLVWNAESGGPISASAPALLKFMHSYWLTGEPRDSGNPLWVMYGSLDGSTAIMVWRPDGIDLVALFNGRGSVTHDEISRDLQAVIERLKEKQGSSLQ